MTFEDLVQLAEKTDGYLYGDVDNDTLIHYLREEVDELQDASRPIGVSQRFNQIEELGDVLFCLVAYARQNNIDINHALSLTVCKLQDRIKIQKRNGNG